MKLNNIFNDANATLHGVVGFGMSLAVAFLVVELLFPGHTHIVGNVSNLINSFIDKGLVGLIALMAFMAMYSRK
jgi:hypothetical protein